MACTIGVNTIPSLTQSAVAVELLTQATAYLVRQCGIYIGIFFKQCAFSHFIVKSPSAGVLLSPTMPWPVTAQS